MTKLPTYNCYGCWGCVNICPKNAVNMVDNGEGFLYPSIDMHICIECGKCQIVCPSNYDFDLIRFDKPKTFAAWHKDKEIQKASSSGGIFSALASIVLEKNGFVAGAAFDKNWILCHNIINNEKALNCLRGSKYIQSEIRFTYSQVQSLLNKQTHVLFSGTPCQVAGLYSYLGDTNYSNLITCEIICHGVGSPLIFKRHLNEINTSKVDVNNINFRYRFPTYKVGSLLINYINSKKYIKMHLQDPFMRLFMYNFILRKCCGSCRFAKLPRIADITLGDFWNIEKVKSIKQRNKHGSSVIIINSNSGLLFFNECKKLIESTEVSINDALPGNPNITSSPKHHSKRDLLFSFASNGTSIKNLNSYFSNEGNSVNRFLRFIKWNIIGKFNQILDIK